MLAVSSPDAASCGSMRPAIARSCNASRTANASQSKILKNERCEINRAKLSAPQAFKVNWWRIRDLNPGPKDYDSSALTAELIRLVKARQSRF